MSEPVETRILEHGAASSLPVRPWLWRRTLVFLCTGAAFLAALWVLGKTSDIATLRMIARLSLGVVYFCLFLYVAGATAQDVVHLVQAARTTRKETIMSGPPPATATPDGVDSEAGELPASDPPSQPPWERKP